MKQVLMTLLLALSLLFWAWMTDVLWLGVLLVLLLLASFAFKAKYDFEATSFYQGANFSALIVAAIFAFYWLDDKASKSILPTVRLLPVALMPLLLMQYISKGFAVPVASLLFFQRKKSQVSYTFDISPLFFMVILLSAGAVAKLGLIYFTGVSVLLLMFLLIQQHGKGTKHYAFLVLVFLVAEGVGLAVVYGIQDAQMRIEARINAWILSYNDGSKASSAMGEVGRLKLSDAIIFRIKADNPLQIPLLLREGSYQRYVNNEWYGGSWQEKEVPLLNERWILSESDKATQRFTVFQSFDVEKFSLALPQTTLVISNLPVDGLKVKQGARIEAQGLPPFVAFDVWFNPNISTQSEVRRSDLGVGKQEAKSIAKFAKIHGLYQLKYEQGEAKVVQAVSDIFRNQFQYSIWQKINPTEKTALAYFLEDTFSGHCEYFATATVLILRELGIPARYVVGYSLSEWQHDMYVVRGRDAHAWAEAMVDDVWVAIDNTPANWLSIENEGSSVLQGLNDWFSGLSFKFKQWRYNSDKDTNLWYWVLATLFVFLAYRTLKRVRLADEKTFEADAKHLDTDWLSLEYALNEMGYQRNDGETNIHWFSRLDGGRWLNIAKRFDKKWYAKYRLSHDEHILLHEQVKVLKDKLDQEKHTRG